MKTREFNYGNWLKIEASFTVSFFSTNYQHPTLNAMILVWREDAGNISSSITRNHFKLPLLSIEELIIARIPSLQSQIARFFLLVMQFFIEQKKVSNQKFSSSIPYYHVIMIDMERDAFPCLITTMHCGKFAAQDAADAGKDEYHFVIDRGRVIVAHRAALLVSNFVMETRI